MDALEYSILRVTRHSSRPLTKQEILDMIRQQRDRLPVRWVPRVTIDALINQLDDNNRLDSRIVSPDGQKLVIGYEITEQGEQRLLELADRV